MNTTMSTPTAPLVIIPTYNEAENITGIVERLRDAVPHAHVLVVDDNSPDGTGDIVDALAAADPHHIHVLHRLVKDGLAGAYLAGFAWGLDRGYPVLVEMDADGSHRPEQLPAILEALNSNSAAMAQGSRWVPGGSVVNWPLSRKLLSKGGSFYARTMLGMTTRDLTGGFRAYTADILRAIRLDTVAAKGYSFQIDLARRVHLAGGLIVEVPITFADRTLGESKMSSFIIVEALAKVTGWGVDRLLHRSPLA